MNLQWVLFLAFASLTVPAATYYCDPLNGNAKGDGSAEHPWQTLEEVTRAKLIQLCDQQGKPTNPNAVVKPGDTLLLRSGWQGAFSVSGGYNQEPITIAAAPGQSPQVGWIEIGGGKNWIVRGLTVSPSLAPAPLAKVPHELVTLGELGGEDSADLVVEDCFVYSVLETTNWTGRDWVEKPASGIWLGRHGRHHLARNNYVLNTRFGIQLCAPDCVAEGNVVVNFSADGMRATRDGQVLQYNVIKNNFVGARDGDDNHDDGIQVFLFNVGTGTVRDVTLRGNIIIARETDGLPFPNPLQGIGCFDGPLIHFLVESNVVCVNHYHGISLYDAQGCTIQGNACFSRWPDRARPWIMLGEKKNQAERNTVRNNFAHTYNFKADAQVKAEDNGEVTQTIFNQKLAALSALIDAKFGALHPTAKRPRLLYHKSVSGSAVLKEEHFDQEPAHWEGINNRGSQFQPRIVNQDFGYSGRSHHVGEKEGEVGGRINPAAEPAYYGYRLPKALGFDEVLSASGKLFVAHGPGHFLLGFFNPDTLKEWRTPNTLAARINGRGEGFHCHLEYCTSRWRAGAGLIGESVPGGRITAKMLPCDRVYDWRLAYEPDQSAGTGSLTLTLSNQSAHCTVTQEHRADGATFTHFGLLPVLKSWDNAGQVWIADLTVNGKQFDFTQEPGWEGVGNRQTYETKNTRPHFDFGWSPTHWADGKAAGELGGLIFRGDCRDPNRLAAYGDRLSPLNLDNPLFARGKVCMIRGVSDSTASIGFYHSQWSLRTNSAQDQAVPMDYLGINIEGPSSEGFFFYPVYRAHRNAAKTQIASPGPRLRISPDRSSHDWTLYYDPGGATGRGRITVSLDGQTCTLDLEAADRAAGASFDRFGLCTPWIDGNSVTVFFDDLHYTATSSH